MAHGPEVTNSELQNRSVVVIVVVVVAVVVVVVVVFSQCCYMYISASSSLPKVCQFVTYSSF